MRENVEIFPRKLESKEDRNDGEGLVVSEVAAALKVKTLHKPIMLPLVLLSILF